MSLFFLPLQILKINGMITSSNFYKHKESAFVAVATVEYIIATA